MATLKSLMGIVSLCISAMSMVTFAASAATSKSDVRLIPLNVARAGNHYFDHATSVWLDGEWRMKNGLSGPRYVDAFVEQTGRFKGHPAIGWVNMNEQTTHYWKNYICPEKIGSIYITGITGGGEVVHFINKARKGGTLNLKSGAWALKSSVTKKIT